MAGLLGLLKFVAENKSTKYPVYGIEVLSRFSTFTH